MNIYLYDKWCCNVIAMLLHYFNNDYNNIVFFSGIIIYNKQYIFILVI